ncbi:MAG: transporter substrate-binding protein [Clostridiales bacterium]|nr:transporter substrate-binding protein [Clostridiales bacterium]
MKKVSRAIVILTTLAMFLSVFVSCSSRSQSGTTGAEAKANTGTEAKASAGTNAPELQKVKVQMAVNNAKSIDGDVLSQFGKIIKEKSGGIITAELYAGSLGSELEIIEQVRTGTVHMYLSSTATLSSYAPQFNTFSIPYLYPNKEKLLVSWKGRIGQAIGSNYQKKDIYLYTSNVLMRGYRHLTSNKEVRTAADVKGIKLRLPETKEWVTVWKTIGAIPYPLSSSELFSALQTGVVDAQENPIISNHDKALWEVQKYTIMTSHIVDFLPLTYSKKWFDGLNKPTHELISKCTEEALVWGNEEAVSREAKAKKVMEDKGMKFVEIDTSSFRSAALPAMDTLKAGWEG